jgi:PAS domain S-box-containing protein
MTARASGHGRESEGRRVKRLEARNLELARTLQLVEEARASLADQYDFAPVGFVTLDAKGCIREINLTAARILGRERSHLLGIPFFTQVAKPHCRTFLNHLRECRIRQMEIMSDVVLRTGGSSTLPVELRSVPVLDTHRGDTVYRTAITDITERLRAGNALRESEERYRDLVEFSPDGIFVRREGKIVFANSAAVRLCGMENPRDLIGSDIADWVASSFRQSLAMALLGPCDGGTATIEARLSRQNNTTVEVEISAHRFRYEGEPAVLVLARDITRRKKAEREVLEISERERTNFGREVHDGICQSLLGVCYLVQVLKTQMRGVSPEVAADADEIARIVRECAEEARNLARGLCPVGMDNGGLVAALHSLTAGVTRRSLTRISLECDDQLKVNDVSVATNLYRIAQEAVSNAIRHGKAKSVLIQLAADDGKLTLQVRDDGKGFPAKPKQTGMGLHTMRYRATMIGGSLDVRPSRPRGTVVMCSFPTNGETHKS